jgi:hypothetical protein
MLSRSLLLCACLVVASVSPFARAAADSLLASYVSTLATKLDVRERDTLERIPQLDRRLLALRAYIRAGSSLASRWSWTHEEIREYQQSNEYRQLLDDLNEVRRAFERANPGYSLFVNTQVRSLDLQLERWNSNAGVGKTAANLRRDALAVLARLGAQPDPESLEKFEQFLMGWRPVPVAPLAAPGLSMHGQMRAIDFQIVRGERIVAGTTVARVGHEWEAPGWDRKLQQAVLAAGDRFSGPLKSPNEPWHFEYRGPAAEPINQVASTR